jgi:hypothetical protein
MSVRERAIVVVVLAVALALGVVAVLSAETDDPSADVTQSGGTDEIVEALQPGRGDQALQQAQVGIDLASGWTGILVIEGTEVRDREDGLVERPELNQLFFTPDDGLVVERWPAGTSCVAARVWRLAESEERSQTINWCFEVA